MRTLARLWPLAAGLLAVANAPAWAQKAPEMGYLYPPGGKAGTTVNLRIGGYDWTPDMQIFVHDPRVRLETTGPAGPITVPPPPYWFGSKAYTTALPLPREIPARLTLPADLKPGPIRWQAANANGGTTTGIIVVADPSDGEEVLEQQPHRGLQSVPKLPCVVSGRLFKNEEVDRYRFTAPADGPLTLLLTARRLGSNLNGALQVRDEAGRVVADTADTDGRDAALTFAAKAGKSYAVEVHDVDFRGDFSYVYRLAFRPGPRVLAALPAAGRRGETHPVEFLVDTGKPKPERITRPVAFPADSGATSLAYRLETPAGTAPAFPLQLSAVPERAKSELPPADGLRTLAGAGGISGALDAGARADRYQFAGKKGEAWRVSAEAREIGSSLDLTLALRGPDGKELAKNDDLPGTTDAGLELVLPVDGTYTITVADTSRRRDDTTLYHLGLEPVSPDFLVQATAQVNAIPEAGAKLAVRVIRRGGWNGAVTVTASGLPAGMSAPPVVVAPGTTDAALAVSVAPGSAVSAGLISLTAAGEINGTAATRTAIATGTGDLAPWSTRDNEVTPLLVAGTMKPRCYLAPVDKDGGRRIHRGATYPAEVIVNRLEGFKGEVSLQMAAHQSYTCMGITGPDFPVPPGVELVRYPCFMPEWLETNRTSRMILVGVTRVPDPKGNIRYLMAPIDGRITMAMEGALLKLAHTHEERMVRSGQSFRVPVQLSRAPQVTEPVRLELIVPDDWSDMAGLLHAEPVTIPSGKSDGEVTIVTKADPRLLGEVPLVLRATVSQPGGVVIVSETEVPIEFTAK